MATTTVTTFDKDGRIVETQTVDVPVERVNADALDSRLDGALEGLRSYVAMAAPTQAQTVVVVKVLCRVAIALIRLTRGRLDATD